MISLRNDLKLMNRKVFTELTIHGLFKVKKKSTQDSFLCTVLVSILLMSIIFSLLFDI
jgi:hypothetical protein